VLPSAGSSLFTESLFSRSPNTEQWKNPQLYKTCWWINHDFLIQTTNKAFTSDHEDPHPQQKLNPHNEQSTLLHPSSRLIIIEQLGHRRLGKKEYSKCFSK
jgi:hypothetical protein